MFFRQFFIVWMLVGFACFLTAQSNTRARVADLNHDGFPDTLAFFDDPVPCDYDYLFMFTDGKSGEKMSVPREEYCRCHIRSVISIPSAMWLPENADVLAIVKARLLREERSTPDPSFAWVLRGLENRRRIKDDPYFELVIDPGLELRPGKAELPGIYSVPLNGKPFKHLLASGFFKPGVTADQGYATYYGHNHYQRRDQRADSVLLVASTHDLEIYRTSHGLFAQSPAHHHWLFVTDHALTGAPDKLRWPSIGDVAIWDDRLLILQHQKPVSGGTAVFLIDLESGRSARLQHELLGEPDDRITFSVDGNSLGLKATSPGDAEKDEVGLVLSLEIVLEALNQL